MLFAVLLRPKHRNTAVPRPLDDDGEGIRVLAEYWVQPRAVSILEAAGAAAVRTRFAGWENRFQVRLIPASSAAEGLALARRLIRRQETGRLSPPLRPGTCAPTRETV